MQYNSNPQPLFGGSNTMGNQDPMQSAMGGLYDGQPGTDYQALQSEAKKRLMAAQEKRAGYGKLIGTVAGSFFGNPALGGYIGGIAGGGRSQMGNVPGADMFGGGGGQKPQAPQGGGGPQLQQSPFMQAPTATAPYKAGQVVDFGSMY